MELDLNCGECTTEMCEVCGLCSNCKECECPA